MSCAGPRGLCPRDPYAENEEDYAKGDAALNAMPAGDTPGQRTSVTKYDVAIRMAD